MTEREQQNRNTLFELMYERPALPIIPMVHSEIVADPDEYTYWIASLGAARVGEYWISAERVYVYDPTDEDEMCRVVNASDLLRGTDRDAYDLTTEEVRVLYRKLPWRAAILLDIVTPDD